MTAKALTATLPTFQGLDGLPLTAGYVYFGDPNQDPRQYPKTVFYDQALSVPAGTVLRTSAGYLFRNGSPTAVWSDGNCSVLVLDANQRQVYYFADWSGAGVIADVAALSGSVADLAALSSHANDMGILAPHANDMGILSPHASDMGALSSHGPDMGALAPHANDMGLLAPRAGDMGTLAPQAANIGTTATNIGSVNTLATNIAVVQQAVAVDRIVATTAAGLAAYASGQYFAIPSGTLNGFLDLYLNNGGSALFVNTYPALSAINAYIDSVNKAASLYSQKAATFTVGTSGNPITGTGLAANTYAWAAPLPKDGLITQFQFWATGTGTVKLKVFDATFNERTNKSLACVAGLNTYTTKDLGSITVNAGEILGFYSTVGVSTAGTDTRAAYYNGGAGDLTAPAHTTVLSSLVLQAQVTVSTIITSASSDTLNNAMVSRVREEAKVVHRLGHQGDTVPDGTGVAGTSHFVFLDPTARTGRLAKFRAFMSAAGYVTIYRWTRSGDTITRDTNPLDVFLMPIGYSEVSLDIALEPGVYLSAQSGSFRQTASTKFAGRGYLNVALATTSFLVDGTTAPTTATQVHFALELEYSSYIGQVQKHRVTLGRSDCIALIGNSFGAGAYHPYKKTWLALLSQMSPWTFHNLSFSGATLANRLASIRSGAPDFYSNASDGNAYGTTGGGATYRDYRNVYALIILGQNTASSAALMNDLHDTLETVRSAGAIPLLVSEIANVVHQLAVYRQFAERYGALFLDTAQFLTMFPNAYAGFANGVHKNMRVTGSLYAAHIHRFIDANLGSPRTGIKMYRPRPGFTYAVAADLMYETSDLNHILATKWQEIEIGGGIVLSGDANIAFMDSINSTGSYATTAQTYSEYLKAQNGHALSFTDFALLSCHIDVQPSQCREVRIYVGTGHTAVYARSPFTTPTGIYSAGAYPSAGAQQGFWHALPVTSDGWAIVREWELSGKLTGTGRIDFLVEHAGAFTLQSPEVVYWGGAVRTRLAPISQTRPKGAETITNPAPYNAGSLASGWSSTGAPTLANTANGGDLPKNTTGYVRLISTDAVSVTGTFAADPFYGREVEISVWCCGEKALVNSATYAASPTTAPMSNDTWDGEQITIEHVASTESAKSTITVMPGWQEVRVKTWLEATKTAVQVRIGCASTGTNPDGTTKAVLVARASCKLVEG